jgi:hypothetical protein
LGGQAVGGVLDRSGAAPALSTASLTPAMLIDTSRMPLAARCTLRVISWVATVCSPPPKRSSSPPGWAKTAAEQGQKTNDSVASLAEAAQRLGAVVS